MSAIKDEWTTEDGSVRLPLGECGDSIAESLAKDGLTESDLIGGES